MRRIMKQRLAKMIGGGMMIPAALLIGIVDPARCVLIVHAKMVPRGRILGMMLLITCGRRRMAGRRVVIRRARIAV